MSVARDDAAPARGRPSSYSDDMALYICEQLAIGRSLRAICADDAMPDASTVFRWLDAQPAFREQYARARALQAEHLASEIIEIADDSSGDVRQDADGNVVVDHEHIQRSKLRVDTRKWYASKLAPRVYGDRVMTEVTGADGGPVRHSVVVDDAHAVLLLLAQAQAIDVAAIEGSTPTAAVDSET